MTWYQKRNTNSSIPLSVFSQVMQTHMVAIYTYFMLLHHFITLFCKVLFDLSIAPQSGTKCQWKGGASTRCRRLEVTHMCECIYSIPILHKSTTHYIHGAAPVCQTLVWNSCALHQTVHLQLATETPIKMRTRCQSLLPTCRLQFWQNPIQQLQLPRCANDLLRIFGLVPRVVKEQVGMVACLPHVHLRVVKMLDLSVFLHKRLQTIAMCEPTEHVRQGNL